MSEIFVEFDRSTQSIGALREAAYRLIGVGTCRIETSENRYICILEPSSAGKAARKFDPIQIRERFIELVTDENLREKVSTETGHVRDLILALAFGALVQEQSH